MSMLGNRERAVPQFHLGKWDGEVYVTVVDVMEAWEMALWRRVMPLWRMEMVWGFMGEW